MNGLTFGHMLYAMALIEVVIVSLLAANMMRANPDAPAPSAYIILAAAIATAIGLIGVAAFTEFGRIPIL